MYSKGTLKSKVSKRYLKAQGIDKVSKVPEYSKDTQRFKVSKSTERLKVFNMYLKVQSVQKVSKGPMYPKGTLRIKLLLEGQI